MNENSKTVSIKMSNGDELFAELIHDPAVEDQNLIKLYQPCKVQVKATNMMLSPWGLFTDDLFYFVQADHVVSINTLDDQHKQIYGAMLINNELKTIQSDLSHKVKTGLITSDKIDDALKDTLMVLMKGGLKYNVPLPSRERVENDFYIFLMGQYPNDTEVLS